MLSGSVFSISGLMLSGNEVSQILLSLILTYYGGQRNRPLWIAWGVACSSISCFIVALPHFIFGPGEDALALTEEYLDSNKLMQNNHTLSSKYIPAVENFGDFKIEEVLYQ